MKGKGVRERLDKNRSDIKRMGRKSRKVNEKKIRGVENSCK